MKYTVQQSCLALALGLLSITLTAFFNDIHGITRVVLGLLFFVSATVGVILSSLSFSKIINSKEKTAIAPVTLYRRYMYGDVHGCLNVEYHDGGDGSDRHYATVISGTTINLSGWPKRTSCSEAPNVIHLFLENAGNHSIKFEGVRWVLHDGVETDLAYLAIPPMQRNGWDQFLFIRQNNGRILGWHKTGYDH